MLRKIISGGQTGADQAGLDAAIKHNIPHGGAIPKGKMTAIESGRFVLCFLALFVLMLPFVFIVPVVAFYSWFEKLTMFEIYTF